MCCVPFVCENKESDTLCSLFMTLYLPIRTHPPHSRTYPFSVLPLFPSRYRLISSYCCCSFAVCSNLDGPIVQVYRKPSTRVDPLEDVSGVT